MRGGGEWDGIGGWCLEDLVGDGNGYRGVERGWVL